MDTIEQNATEANGEGHVRTEERNQCVRPTSIRHFVSQKGVIDQVVVALDAAQMDGEKFPNALLVGPPGLGKSALAGIIAAEMAVEMHELLGQSVQSAADLHALLLAAKPKAIVFVDEAHELATTFQTALYLALDKQKIVLSGGNGNHPQSIPLANFSVLLGMTTNSICSSPFVIECG